ncbi:MAG TPA: NBR1-Ig-like domain-containing protein [Anaerolineales bacterium]|nr:NBR1-Ig-like domain-containing protein [Anaerolineales bacterium]
MSKSQYLILAGLAGVFFIILAIGVGLLAMPILLDRPASQTETATPGSVVIFPTETGTGLPSETPAPTETLPPTTTPSAAPMATATTIPSPTATPIPCNWAEFVSDVTVKDGDVIAPGVSFTKTWRIRNIGSCTWNSDYDIVFSSGNDLNAATTIALPATVRPGETIDLSIPMKAPDQEGTYTGYWQLRAPDGMRFGLGAERTGAIWVRINVVLPCYWAAFVADVTVPDDTAMTPGAEFVKIWRLRNIGDCDWTTGFEVFASSGDKMAGTAVDMPERVEPGETIDIAVTLVAPGSKGDYRGYWMIEASDGTRFGLGNVQTSAFWVDIRVLDTDHEYVYDFAANYCLASWKSGVGPLPCPGTEKTSGSFIIRLNNPHLENRTENEPALWTAPDADPDGWISGKYPAIVIRDGDRFKAWVGCLDGADGCEVTFYLQYQIAGGTVMTLGSWDEVHDGAVTQIDVDLSFLAGQAVSIILVAEVDGGDPVDAEAFWFSPRIE